MLLLSTFRTFAFTCCTPTSLHWHCHKQKQIHIQIHIHINTSTVQPSVFEKNRPHPSHTAKRTDPTISLPSPPSRTTVRALRRPREKHFERKWPTRLTSTNLRESPLSTPLNIQQSFLQLVLAILATPALSTVESGLPGWFWLCSIFMLILMLISDGTRIALARNVARADRLVSRPIWE